MDTRQGALALELRHGGPYDTERCRRTGAKEMVT